MQNLQLFIRNYFFHNLKLDFSKSAIALKIELVLGVALHGVQELVYGVLVGLCVAVLLVELNHLRLDFQLYVLRVDVGQQLFENEGRIGAVVEIFIYGHLIC